MWQAELFNGQTVAGAVMILSLVIASGLAIGALRVKGVGLGIAGVLFAGLAFSHFKLTINPHVLEFVREFGLILFVYTIGLQVGPGFLASLKREGLPLNIMAAAIVLLGVAVTVGIYFVAKVEPAVLVGMFSGATTNTPSLAAAQQALKNVSTNDPAVLEQLSKLPGLGYAVAYPFGIVGIILSMVLVRAIFRINVPREHEDLTRLTQAVTPGLRRANIEVTNPNLAGRTIKDLLKVGHSSVVISRMRHGNDLIVPTPETSLALGDVLLAVGSPDEIDSLHVIVGRESDIDLRALPSEIITQPIVVTHAHATGSTLGELDFVRRYGVQITRVTRAEIEMTSTPGFRLQHGDSVLAVGTPQAIAQVAGQLGNSPRTLNYPHLVPVFVGIVLGLFVGSIPIPFPGISGTIKLGMAGGPLLVAMILSRVGTIGPLFWYMPVSANLMLREVGIVLFLAAVGLKSGDVFVESLTHGEGLHWMMLGAIITLLPLLIVAVAARLLRRTNYLSLCGLLAGSMTDPPALAFANNITGSDSPSMIYATVYPLTMILRVLCAQVLVIVLVR